MPKLPGTILPTPESDAAAERCYMRVQAMKRRIGENTPELVRATLRIQGGEARYYATPDRYAIVNDAGRVLWFERRADGEWYADRSN